jgi:hypothetical protein
MKPLASHLRRYALLAVACPFALSVGGISVAQAEERVCRGTIGAVTLDNVRVPPGATCRLERTRAKGTVKVERGGRLTAVKVVVIGNVQAEGAASVAVRNGSRIGGSVQIVQGGGATIVGSQIDGSIQLESNRAALRVLNNVVDADVQAFQNSGGVEISDNRIDGNLQCKSNTPAPTGDGNVVQGNKEDQCRDL